MLEGCESAVWRTCGALHVCGLCPPSILFLLQQITLIFPGQSPGLCVQPVWLAGVTPPPLLWARDIGLASQGHKEQFTDISPETVAKMFFLFVGLWSWSCWLLSLLRLGESLSESEVCSGGQSRALEEMLWGGEGRPTQHTPYSAACGSTQSRQLHCPFPGRVAS